MTIRQTNLLLKCITALLATAAIGLVVAGVTTPLDLPAHSPEAKAQSPVKHPVPKLPPITSFSPVFARSLQASASVASAAATSQTDQQPSQSSAVATQLSLVGTIGDSVALIKGPDGTVGMAEPGDDVNGAPLVAIRPSECDLRINGKLTTLKVAPPPSDQNMISPAK